MKISNKIIKALGKFMAGDTGAAPYLKGPELVDFFNECGFDDVYASGFPSRWLYTAEKIAQANNSDLLRRIFEEFTDIRRYNGSEETLTKVVIGLNELLKPDGFGLIKYGNSYRVTDLDGNVVQVEVVKARGHDFINEQIQKCNEKILSEDYNGAITNARTLLEAVFIDIIERAEKTEVKNDGNLLGLWSRCKKALKLDFGKNEIPDFVLQILGGLDTVLNGLSGISNNAGDRHANKFRTLKHHAKLAVNSAMTICDFITEISINRGIPRLA